MTARQAGSAAMIEISDQGAGIPKDIQDKIFNLYFTTKKAGSGIGLAMTYRVLQLHNGALEFETEQGKGTVFRLQVPLEMQVRPESCERNADGALRELGLTYSGLEEEVR